eukprot:CAMPEP_0113484020 /NCGR_PEP_ID=MMETSP0014_2-20120614/23740_1 /TAXON_ID=2857 /ORGANISM="Nitzschia sp." /LENGTH=269 /DNA_ID=CAMNT_0000377597 /DNA_START=279 /DNA_END=1088 /DNA_ORIENTATION=- /assembly_acc=CAM_ASM_000159
MSGAAAAAASAASRQGSSKYKGALIFLHGLGDTPAGWSYSITEELPELQPQLSDIKYVFPHAPVIPIEINGGAKMTGWFDLYDWPIAVGSQDDPVGLKKAVEQVRTEITKLIEEDGIPPSKIVVGGFSQGGAVALLSCYYYNNKDDEKQPFPLAGCAGLSAWLTLPDEVLKTNDRTDGKEILETVQRIPLFWGHGQYDDKVLFEQQPFGVQKLHDFGLKEIDARQYPMGHSSFPTEMKDLANFVHKCIFETNDSDEGAKTEEAAAKSEL